MHVMELERLLVQHRLFTDTAELPGGGVGKLLVVPPGFSFRGLEFLAKMASAGFVSLQGVEAHQLSELKEVTHPFCLFERLIEFFAVTEDPHVAPELFAQLR